MKMVIGCCWFFVFHHFIQSSADAIRFTSGYHGQTVTGLVGSSVNFTWSFSGGVEIVTWGLSKVGLNVVQGKLVSLLKNGAMEVAPAYIGRASGSRSGASSAGQAIFTLSSITKNDERYFICKIDPEDPIKDNSAFDHVQLVVNVLPQISLLSVPASYNEGSPVNINCTASGKPDPDVKWIKNGKVISSGKKTAFLILNSIKRADDGQYTCRANNSVGNDVKHTTLVVHYKPEGTTLTISAAKNTVTQGDSVTLSCHVTAAKPQVSQYRFYLNGTLVKAASDNQYTINNVQRSLHYGKYKCIPQNDVGDGPEATAVTLHVNVPVQFTAIPQNVTVNETNPIAVSCDASGFPVPSIKWKKHGQGNPVMKELNIHSSNRSDTGIYVCTASNGMGHAQKVRVYVAVQYPPTIQEAITSAVKSWIGQTVTLKCVSDGVPTPTLTWYKPDGSQISNSTATEYTVNVKMNVDQDFGDYKCNANNGLTPADNKIVNVTQIKKPGSPTITSSGADIQATSLTVKWNPPADNGGSPITAYRVVILKSGTEIKNINITDPGTTSRSVGGLERDTNYTVKVFARNAVFEGPAGQKSIKTKYEGVPATAEIYGLPSEVTNDTITLKWKEPQDNGKVITQYTVYQRIVTDGKPGEWSELKKITNVSVRELKVELEKGKEYEFVVTATNALNESLKEDGKIKKVLASGVPAAVKISDIPSEVTDSTITLKWSKPQDYGREITKYTVYQKIVNDGKPGDWEELQTITNVSVRELKVELEKGKEYEFVVTATNVHGESSSDEGNSKRIKALGDAGGGGGSQKGDGDDNGMNPAIYAGVAAAGVLLIIGIIVIIVLWRRKKSSSHDETSADELGSANPYELEDGYQAVSRAAAENLQASGSGAEGAEANYAQVDLSKKKKNRRPPTDEYAQVDKSKKTKKTPKKKPGELEYAELGDLRRELQAPPAPSGAAAAAAYRPPAYEGTEYADIAQFGVPQPDPTYANVTKGEVVYSNVESM